MQGRIWCRVTGQNTVQGYRAGHGTGLQGRIRCRVTGQDTVQGYRAGYGAGLQGRIWCRVAVPAAPALYPWLNPLYRTPVPTVLSRNNYTPTTRPPSPIHCVVTMGQMPRSLCMLVVRPATHVSMHRHSTWVARCGVRGWPCPTSRRSSMDRSAECGPCTAPLCCVRVAHCMAREYNTGVQSLCPCTVLCTHGRVLLGCTPVLMRRDIVPGSVPPSGARGQHWPMGRQ